MEKFKELYIKAIRKKRLASNLESNEELSWEAEQVFKQQCLRFQRTPYDEECVDIIFNMFNLDENCRYV